MIKTGTYNQQSGLVSVSLVTSIVFGIFALVFGSIMIWALVNYNDQKNNVETKISLAVKDAKTAQKNEDEKDFEEQEKQPLKEFVGPNDLGRVNFKHPKTWSVYVASAGLNGTNYEAYFNPEQVPSVQGQANKYALRLSILNQSYETVIQKYAGLVKSGQLRSESITANGFTGQKFEGNLSREVDGTVVLFKIRDKTLVLQTDAPTFKPDFNDKILKDLNFDQ